MDYVRRSISSGSLLGTSKEFEGNEGKSRNGRKTLERFNGDFNLLKLHQIRLRCIKREFLLVFSILNQPIRRLPDGWFTRG